MGRLKRSSFARNETHRLMQYFDGFALSLLPIYFIIVINGGACILGGCGIKSVDTSNWQGKKNPAISFG